MADGYQRQVASGGTAPLPEAPAGVFGAATAEAISNFGKSVGDLGTTLQQNQRDAQNAQFGSDFAKYREAQDAAIQQARDNAQPGGFGHAATVSQWQQQNSAALLANVSDNHLRRALQTQLDEYDGSVRSRELNWQAGQQAAKTVVDERTAGESSHARIATATDLPSATAVLGNERQLAYQRIEAYSGIDADAKAKMRSQWDDGAELSLADLGIRTDPHAVQQLAARGAFDGLSPEKLSSVLNSADAAVRRNEAEARAAQAHQVALVKDQAAAARATLESGAGTPSDWGTLANTYHAVGDESAATEARIKGAEMQASLQHRGDSLPAMDARLAQLDAKQGAGGMSPAEAAERKGLASLREQSSARLSQPGGPLLQLQYASGKPIAPLDLANPQSFTARAATAAAAAAQYGRATIEPLLPAETTQLKDLVSSGKASERLQALELIGHFGNPQVVMGAARQLAEQGDGEFRIAATLTTMPNGSGSAAARDILRGGDALKTGAGGFAPARQQAEADFRGYALPAMRDLPDYASDVLKAAQAIYGTRAAARGVNHFDNNLWHESIDAAMGATKAPDGTQLGGITKFTDGTPVRLPAGWSGFGLFNRLARGSKQDWVGAYAGKPPVWPDGSGVMLDQIRQLPPVWLGGTRYGFRTRAGNMLGATDGGPFVIDVQRFPFR